MTPRTQPLSRILQALACGLLLLMGCASTPDELPSALALAPAPRTLEYHLEIAPRYAIVELKVRRPAASVWRFRAASEQDGAVWYDLRARDARGRELPVVWEEDADAWRVDATQGEDFTLRYLVIQPLPGLDDTRGAMTTRRQFAGFGHALFAIPEAGDPKAPPIEEVHLSLEAPKGWELRSTWGRRSARVPELRALRGGLITAGGWSFAQTDISRSDLFVAADPRLTEGADLWTPKIEQLAETQASFFGSYPLNAIMVALVLGEKGEVAATSASGGLVVEVPAGWANPEDPRVLRVVAREHFRMFTERWMHPEPPRQGEAAGLWPAWFVEGGAEYYAARTLLALKLLDGPAFLELVNHWIAEEASSRWATTAVPDPGLPASWRTPDAQRYARARGALVSLLLDVTLRTGSQGLTSLDHLLRRMGFDFGGSAKGYTHGDLLERIQAFTRQDLSSFFARYIEGFAPLPLDYLDRAGILMDTAPGQRFDPGFTWEAADGEAAEARFIVRTVEPGSPAARAGLSEGDLLASLEVSSRQIEAIRLLQRAGDEEASSPHARFERAPLAFSPLREATLLHAASTTELFDEWFRSPR